LPIDGCRQPVASKSSQIVNWQWSSANILRLSVDDEKDTLHDSPSVARDLDLEQARLAYSIIQSLLEHTRIVSDLVAVMAQTLDEDTQRALTQTPNWAAYLESRRTLERTRADVEKFAEVMKQLDQE
jgi:hypothetical protein